VEYQINEQLPIFFELSNALGYTGLQKFNHFGQYLSGAFKLAWENEVRTNYAANHQRTHPGFDRALIGTWIRFYGQQDLRKAGLKLIASLKWKKMHRKYDHTPVQFTQRIETLYAVLKRLDTDPGTTPMPTARQKKESLVESFPKDYQVYFECRGGDYSESMAEIGQMMKDHFDRENESDSDDSVSSSSDDDSSDSDSSQNSSSDSDSDRQRKRKRSKKDEGKRRMSKKDKKDKKKHKKHSKKKSKKRSKHGNHRRTPATRIVQPKWGNECPLHGGHTWGDCRLNCRGPNYDPPKPWTPRNSNKTGQGTQYRGQSNYRGRNNQTQNNAQGQNQGYHFDDPNEQVVIHPSTDNGDAGKYGPYHNLGTAREAPLSSYRLIPRRT
jgi:hypothetical protein